MAEVPALRFAVLHHTGVAKPHYDVLIETAPDAPLRAFRADAWPLAPEAVLERLPDHRRMYLEYQGPISAGRGHVARIDEGVCTIRVDAAEAFEVDLASASSGARVLRLAAIRPPYWRAAAGMMNDE